MSEWIKHQQDIATWKAKIMPPYLNTPKEEYNRSLEEMKELHDAIASDNGTKAAAKEIGGEAVDVIIRMLGIASIVGMNVGTALDKKIKVTTEDKYRPDRIQAHLAEGMTWHQAMSIEKQLFQRRNPPIRRDLWQGQR